MQRLLEMRAFSLGQPKVVEKMGQKIKNKKCHPTSHFLTAKKKQFNSFPFQINKYIFFKIEQ